MKLELSTWDRIYLPIIVGQLKGNVAFVEKCIDAMKLFRLSEDEQKLVGLVQHDNGSIEWADKATVWKMEVDDVTLGIVASAVGAYEGWSVPEIESAKELIRKLEV